MASTYGSWDSEGNFTNARYAWNDEIARLEAALASGNFAYGGYEAALNDIYQRFGIPAGVSYQEAQGVIGGLYGQYFPQQGVLGATDEQTPYVPGGGGGGLTQAEIAARNEQHLANLREIKRAYQEGLMSFDEQQNAIADSRNQLIGQKDQGLESNSAYFSNVSPDAFQSQMGNYNQKVLDAYTQGEKTLNNNQEQVDFAKQLFEQRNQEALAAENAFNASTGQYTGGYAYKGGLVPTAPKLTQVTQNPYSEAAKLGVPKWAPNYGGMSVQQTAKQKEDEAINKYLG